MAVEQQYIILGYVLQLTAFSKYHFTVSLCLFLHCGRLHQYFLGLAITQPIAVTAPVLALSGQLRN